MIGLLGALTAFPAAASAQSCPSAPTPDQARCPLADVRYLADDALEGRGVGTPGGLCAAAYIAARFDALGLEPAGPGGSWLQPFPLRIGAVLTGLSRLDVGGQPLDQEEAWAPYGFSGSGNVEAALIYGGTGVSQPGGEPPVAVAGKIVVIEGRTPGAASLYSDPHFKGTVAAGQKARAVLILLSERMPLPRLAEETRPFLAAPVVAVSGAAAAAVREASRRGETARVEVHMEPRFAQVPSVVAALPGSDPTWAEDVVVVGAHLDHLGRGGEDSMVPGSDAIHNGADDNASGVAVMLEVARRLSAGPRSARSVVFIGFNGEERGLQGSAHYVAHPTRPLDQPSPCSTWTWWAGSEPTR